jgi:hypothetical protein
VKIALVPGATDSIARLLLVGVAHAENAEFGVHAVKAGLRRPTSGDVVAVESA